jgi:hypothetical protein
MSQWHKSQRISTKKEKFLDPKTLKSFKKMKKPTKKATKNRQAVAF